MRVLVALSLGAVLALTGPRLAAQQPPRVPGGPGQPGQPFQPPGAVDYKELIPALIDALKDSDPDVRQSAAGALASMGRQAVTPLLDIVKDQGKDKELRANAAYVLGLMGSNGREALPTLTKMLKGRRQGRAPAGRVCYPAHREGVACRRQHARLPGRCLSPGHTDAAGQSVRDCGRQAALLPRPRPRRAIRDGSAEADGQA